MAEKQYSGLTVGLRLDEFTGSYVVGAEISGGFVPFGRIGGSKIDKWLPLTTPEAPPAPAAPVDPVEPSVPLEVPAQPVS